MAKQKKLTKKEMVLAVEIAIYKKSLYHFFMAVAPIIEPSVRWDYNWFYKYVCDILQAETFRIVAKQPKTHNYIFNLPFRAGKSTLISQIYPVWCWIVDPSMKIMTISSNQNLANRHAEKSLIFIKSQWFQQRFGSSFSLRSEAVSDILNDKTGVRMSFGMNAKDITGSGANIVILDDPQTPDDLTPTGIDNTIKKYTDKIYSRLNDPKVDIHILLQQRLHQNDLSGYLLSRDADDEYYHVSIPAMANDMIRPRELIVEYNSRGGLFWPERFGHAELERFSKTLGSRAYAGQLMMKPQSSESSLIKDVWFPRVSMGQFLLSNPTGTNPIPMFIMDTAQTDNTKNDPTALLSCYFFENRLYVFNVETAYLNPANLHTWTMERMKHNGYKAGSIIYIEQASSGPALISYLQRDGYRTSNLIRPSKDKVWRANQCLPEWEGNRVVFIEGAYIEQFVQELEGFPDTAPHDDRVDCLIHATERFLLKRRVLNWGTI